MAFPSESSSIVRRRSQSDRDLASGLDRPALPPQRSGQAGASGGMVGLDGEGVTQETLGKREVAVPVRKPCARNQRSGLVRVKPEDGIDGGDRSIEIAREGDGASAGDTCITILGVHGQDAVEPVDALGVAAVPAGDESEPEERGGIRGVGLDALEVERARGDAVSAVPCGVRLRPR
jgi:hypothetical protein